jgi:hypothetical protein
MALRNEAESGNPALQVLRVRTRKVPPRQGMSSVTPQLPLNPLNFSRGGPLFRVRAQAIQTEFQPAVITD